MRSSKKRSRSGPNRPRPIGNIVNRVFDSSGPEGKVRGTPQQIIEKYQTLARDAQLSNDRVAAENFLQHAEHYTRLLAEAQRELAAEQEARQQQQQQHNGNGGAHQGGRDRDMRDQDRQNERQGERQGERQYERPAERFAERTVERAGEATAAAPLIDLGRDEGGLVDLPEGGGTATRRRTRDERPDQRAPHPEREVRAIDADSPADGDTSSDASSDSGEAHGTESVEPAAKAPARRPRRPRTAPAKAAGKAEIGETAPDAGASA